jgi:hypothetical protein
VSNSCTGGYSACATATSGATAATDAKIKVNCLDAPDVACANGGLTPTITVGGSPGIQSIVMTIIENQSGYTYNLTASPRDQGPEGTFLPPGSTGPAVLLLGSSIPVLSCSGSPSSSLTVNGTLAVNSALPGSLSFGPHPPLTANQVYSQDTTATPPVTPTSAYTGPYASGPAYPDPFGSLPDPATTGPGVTVYTSAVSITSSQTFAPGIYIFEQGLSVSSGATVTGSGVLFFIGIPNAPPSTTQPAAYSVTGNGVVNLSGMTSGTYKGIVIFQSRYDSNQLQIAGNGANSTYGGVIYAPDASVSTSGNGGTFAASIVSSSLACGGNGSVSIGPTFSITSGQILTSLPGTIMGGAVANFGATENLTIHLDTATGTVLATTPSPVTTGASGQANFTVTVPTSATNGSHTLVAVGNTSGTTATSNTFTVNVPPPSVTTTSLASATRTQAGYSQTLTETGGTGPFTWSISSGSLPTGLGLNPGTGTISGTVGATATTQTFTVKVTDTNGAAATKSLTLNVNPPPSVTTTSLPATAHGATGYMQTLTETGGTGPFTWSLQTGSLPAGLTLNAGTGVISGAVTAAGSTQSFTVAVTDTNGVVGTKPLTIVVNPAPTITFPTSGNQEHLGHNGPGATFTVTGANFESGLTVTAGNFTVTAVTWINPTSFSVHVKGTGAQGATANLTVTNPDGGTVSSPNSLLNSA